MELTKRTLIYLIIASALLAMVLYGIGQIDGRLAANEKQAIASDKAFMQLVKGHRKQIDAAIGEAKKWHRIAAQHLAAADTSGQQADEAAADTTADHWHRAYIARTNEVMSVRAALTAKTIEADTLGSALAQANKDIDELTERLDNSLKRNDHKFLGFIPKPSRTVVFIGGVTLGAVAMAAATN